mmetsp:Transcript_76661/g.167450  ORF Transcript_76661/g.167450 Transcript_76661/m.167450 type:complete len:214 (-) Transcript_76661:80-721(-)
MQGCPTRQDAERPTKRMGNNNNNTNNDSNNSNHPHRGPLKRGHEERLSKSSSDQDQKSSDWEFESRDRPKTKTRELPKWQNFQASILPLKLPKDQLGLRLRSFRFKIGIGTIRALELSIQGWNFGRSPRQDWKLEFGDFPRTEKAPKAGHWSSQIIGPTRGTCSRVWWPRPPNSLRGRRRFAHLASGRWFPKCKMCGGATNAHSPATACVCTA